MVYLRFQFLNGHKTRMPQAAIVLKLPKGSAKPDGWTFVRSLRTKNVYKKNAPKPVPQADIDALIAGFAGMGIAAQANGVDDLAAAMGALRVNEGGARKTRRRRGGRKGSKRTRRA
jgi:hypothetical protein